MTGKPQTDRRALARLVEAALDWLPRALRLILVLRDVEGMEAVEVGSAIGLPPAVVEARLHCARSTIQERLVRELVAVAPAIFIFDADRCDRIVARVLESIAIGGHLA